MMAKRRSFVSYSDFTGGLNEDENPTAVKPTEVRTARNVNWRGNAIAARRGQSATASAVDLLGIGQGYATGIFDFVWNAGANRSVVAVHDVSMKSGVWGGSPTDITGAVTITAGQNNLCTFETFNDELLVVNGADSPWKWTGSGNISALGGSPPAFNTIIAKWNRVFGAGHLSAPRTVRHTTLGTNSTWNAADTVQALVGDAGSAIEGRDFIWQLGHLGDSIFCGLNGSVGRIFATGDSVTPFRYTQLADFGQEGAHTYVAVGDSGYFLSRRGVHFIRATDTSLGLESSLISGRRLRQSWSALSATRIKYGVGTLYRSRDGNLMVCWALSSSGATAHDVVLVMDVTDGPGRERFAWWTYTSSPTTTSGPQVLATVREPTTLEEQLLTAVYADTVGVDRPHIVQLDAPGQTDDLGDGSTRQTYIAEFETRWEDFGVPAEKKNWRDLYIETSGNGADITLSVFFDHGSTAAQTISRTLTTTGQAVWGTGVWGTAAWAVVGGFFREFLLGVDDGQTMSIRIRSTTANNNWAVYTMVPAVQKIAATVEE